MAVRIEVRRTKLLRTRRPGNTASFPRFILGGPNNVKVRLASLSLAVAFLAPSTAFANTTMPKCASGDPVVMVNAKTKSYTMMSKSGAAPSSSSGMTMMCKSKATSMGDKMSASSSNAQSARPASGNAGANAMGGNGSPGTSGANGGAGPMTGASPAPAGTSNAGNPPPGPPSHSP